MNINERNTIMAEAIKNKDVDTIRQLIDSGYVHYDIFTPAMENDTETLSLFIDAGADINETAIYLDGISMTALAIAISNHSNDTARYLIEHGAEVNLLENQEDISSAPLRAALDNRNADIMLDLIDAGADYKEAIIVDSPSGVDDGLSAAHLAAIVNNTKLLSFLIDNGAEVNNNDYDGEKPAHLAAELNHPECLKLLIDADAGVNAKGEDDRTPAHWVAKHGQTEILKLMIDHGADIHKRDINGNTPAHLAANNGQAETLKLLIERGADFSPYDVTKDTRARGVAESDHDACLSLIERHNIQQKRLKPLFDKYEKADQKKAALLGSDNEKGKDEGIGF